MIWFSEKACQPRAVVRCPGLLGAARAITKQYFIQLVQKHCSFFNRVKWDKASEFIKVPLRASLFMMFFVININNWHLSCPWDEWRARSRLALYWHKVVALVGVEEVVGRWNVNLAEQRDPLLDAILYHEETERTQKCKHTAIPVLGNFNYPAVCRLNNVLKLFKYQVLLHRNNGAIIVTLDHSLNVTPLRYYVRSLFHNYILKWSKVFCCPKEWIQSNFLNQTPGFNSNQRAIVNMEYCITFLFYS